MLMRHVLLATIALCFPGTSPHAQTSMRGTTRADCVRFAGNELKRDIDACRSPVVSCLTNAGVTRHHAICAAGVLVAALEPTKVSVAGALVACGDQAYSAADVCKTTWGSCQDGPLRAHRHAIDQCRSLK